MAKFSIPTQDTNPDGGGDYLDYQSDKDAGMYHFTIAETADNENDGGDAKVTFEVLAPASHVGKRWNEFFGVFDKEGNFSAGKCNRLMQFAVAAGLFTHEEWQAAKENNEVLDVDLDEALHRSVCAELRFQKEDKSKNRRAGLEMGFRIYSPFSDTAKDFPKDKEVLKDDPRAGSSKPSGGKSAEKKAPPQKADDENDGGGDAAGDFNFS